MADAFCVLKILVGFKLGAPPHVQIEIRGEIKRHPLPIVLEIVWLSVV